MCAHQALPLQRTAVKAHFRSGIAARIFCIPQSLCRIRAVELNMCRLSRPCKVCPCRKEARRLMSGLLWCRLSATIVLFLQACCIQACHHSHLLDLAPVPQIWFCNTSVWKRLADFMHAYCLQLMLLQTLIKTETRPLRVFDRWRRRPSCC